MPSSYGRCFLSRTAAADKSGAPCDSNNTECIKGVIGHHFFRAETSTISTYSPAHCRSTHSTQGCSAPRFPASWPMFSRRSSLVTGSTTSTGTRRAPSRQVKFRVTRQSCRCQRSEHSRERQEKIANKHSGGHTDKAALARTSNYWTIPRDRDEGRQKSSSLREAEGAHAWNLEYKDACLNWQIYTRCGKCRVAPFSGVAPYCHLATPLRRLNIRNKIQFAIYNVSYNHKKQVISLNLTATKEQK